MSGNCLFLLLFCANLFQFIFVFVYEGDLPQFLVIECSILISENYDGVRNVYPRGYKKT